MLLQLLRIGTALQVVEKIVLNLVTAVMGKIKSRFDLNRDLEPLAIRFEPTAI